MPAGPQLVSALLELLADYTVQNVVIGATLLGLISGVLGTFAVLRQQSLLGDTLSHAALPGVCLGFIVAGTRELGFILAGALTTAVLAALVMLVLTRHSRIKTDAGLGIALSVFFAGGVVLLTYLQGTANASQGGLDSFLFGQAAAMLRSDLWVMGGITLAALALVSRSGKSSNSRPSTRSSRPASACRSPCSRPGSRSPSRSPWWSACRWSAWC